MYRMHLHKPDWHAFGMHMDHLVHDPRFWAGLALIILFGMMIISAILFSGSGNGGAARPLNPMVPYGPYMP